MGGFPAEAEGSPAAAFERGERRRPCLHIVDTFAEFSSPKSYKSIKIGGNGVYTKKQKRRGKVSSEYKARRKKKQARRARALQRVALRDGKGRAQGLLGERGRPHDRIGHAARPERIFALYKPP